MRQYDHDLEPIFDTAKSFYGGAYIQVGDTGAETLVSYTTPIISCMPDGSFVRHLNPEADPERWTTTTRGHTREFVLQEDPSLNKNELMGDKLTRFVQNLEWRNENALDIDQTQNGLSELVTDCNQGVSQVNEAALEYETKAR